MFTVAKKIFVRVQKNTTIKKFGQKIRTGDIVVTVFVLYRCAVDASTLHAIRHDTTRLRRRPTVSMIFFGERLTR
jgi:riboflavin synthase